MRFFITFLNHFNAIELLQMFSDGAFRTSAEIKMVDSVVNNKVMFQDESISSDYMRVYEYLQKIMVAIGVLCKVRLENLEEVYRYGSEVPVNFQYFIKYGENEREVPRLNIIERRIIFAFKAREASVDYPMWAKVKHFKREVLEMVLLEHLHLKLHQQVPKIKTCLLHFLRQQELISIIAQTLALAEFLNYVLREFEDADRIGLIIKNEEQPHIQAKFSIKSKCDFVATPIMDTLRSVFNIGDPLVGSGSMTMRALRIRLPVLYRLLTAADLPEECDWLSLISP